MTYIFTGELAMPDVKIMRATKLYRDKRAEAASTVSRSEAAITTTAPTAPTTCITEF